MDIIDRAARKRNFGPAGGLSKSYLGNQWRRIDSQRQGRNLFNEPEEDPGRKYPSVMFALSAAFRTPKWEGEGKALVFGVMPPAITTPCFIFFVNTSLSSEGKTQGSPLTVTLDWSTLDECGPKIFRVKWDTR